MAGNTGNTRRAACAALLLALLGACAPQQKLPPQGVARRAYWSGRLALQVQSAAAVDAYYGAEYGAQMPQTFSAAFTLQGSSTQGELQLFTPLGSTLARLHWQPGQATLERGAQHQSAPALADLLEEALGSAVPVAALFDWLHGRATAASGWQVDLSRLPQGRIRARRDNPPPQATLRLVLDADQQNPSSD